MIGPPPVITKDELTQMRLRHASKDSKNFFNNNQVNHKSLNRLPRNSAAQSQQEENNQNSKTKVQTTLTKSEGKVTNESNNKEILKEGLIEVNREEREDNGALIHKDIPNQVRSSSAGHHPGVPLPFTKPIIVPQARIPSRRPLAGTISPPQLHQVNHLQLQNNPQQTQINNT